MSLHNKYKVQAFEWNTLYITVLGYSFWLLAIYLRLIYQIHYIYTLPLSILGIYTLFTPLHEATHNNISSNIHINYRLGEIIIIPYFFSNFKTFKYIHLQHHAHTNKKNDPDYFSRFGIFSCMCMSIHYYYYYLHTSMTTDYYNNIVYIILRWFLVCISYYIGIISHIFILWIIPSFIGIGLLSYIFDYLPHRNHEHIDTYRHTKMTDGFLTLNNKKGNNIISFITCNQLTYHHVHHLYTKIPFYKYKLFWEEHYKELKDKYTSQTII
jgi:beta-carotene hydroxylase